MEDPNQVLNWRFQRKNDKFSLFLSDPFLTSHILMKTREKRKLPCSLQRQTSFFYSDSEAGLRHNKDGETTHMARMLMRKAFPPVNGSCSASLTRQRARLRGPLCRSRALGEARRKALGAADPPATLGCTQTSALLWVGAGPNGSPTSGGYHRPCVNWVVLSELPNKTTESGFLDTLLRSR